MVVIPSKALVAAHHGADAVEQQASADYARHGRGSSAEKRAAATHHAAAHRGAWRVSGLRVSGLWVSGLWVSGLRRRLACVGPWAPHTARTLSAGPHRRN